METTGTEELNDGAINTVAQADTVVHRRVHVDPEKLDTDKPNRRQPFRAVWVVVACGFALMSDGS